MEHYDILWNAVRDHARQVTLRANGFDAHPTFDSPAAIKNSSIEVHGMKRMALSLTEYRHPTAEAENAIRSMDTAVVALYTRQRKAREEGKGRTKRRMAARSFNRS